MKKLVLIMLLSIIAHQQAVCMNVPTGTSPHASSDPFPLHTACKEGNLEKVKTLVAAGASLVTQDEKGCMPAYRALLSGHHDVVIWLIEQGTPINAEDAKGRTLLHCASVKGSKEIVVYLIRKGAALNQKIKESQRTPLHIAAAIGNLEAVACLIECGAAVNEQDKDLWTPLHFAARSGHQEIVAFLVNHGARVNQPQKSGATPLHLAAMSGHKNMVLYLIEQSAPVDSEDNKGRTPLCFATSQGHKEMVELLISAGACVNKQLKNSTTPLYLALASKHPEVARCLIDHGASVHALYSDNTTSWPDASWTALHVAAEQGLVDSAAYLIKHGALIYAQDKYRLTPFHAAARAGHLDVIKILIGKSFFPPRWNPAVYTQVSEAQKQELIALLQKLDDEEFLKNNPLELKDWSADFIADQVPLEKQKKLVQAWLNNYSFDGDQLKLLINAHVKRHMSKIKKVLAVGMNDTQTTARDIALSKNQLHVVDFITRVSQAQDYSEFDAQDVELLLTTIKNKLAITLQS